MSVYNESCWFVLFSSEWFEATKESFFTLKELALVVYEDIKTKQNRKASFMASRSAFAFHNVKLPSEAALVAKEVVTKFPPVFKKEEKKMLCPHPTHTHFR